MTIPEIVSPAEWWAARERLQAKELEAAAARESLAAERRRHPVTEITKGYTLRAARR